MNREIKFRVWDNKYKYMNYKVLVGIYGDWEKVKDDKNYTACAMWIEPDEIGVITWNKDTASFQIKGHISSSSMKHLDRMKVIGNIYENEVD